MVYCERQKAPKSRFDSRSFRWVLSGRGRILVGCPRGKWQPRAQRCSVGTRAYKVLMPGGTCAGGRRIVKG